jgi:hypothetical protein
MDLLKFAKNCEAPLSALIGVAFTVLPFIVTGADPFGRWMLEPGGAGITLRLAAIIPCAIVTGWLLVKSLTANNVFAALIPFVGGLSAVVLTSGLSAGAAQSLLLIHAR